MSNPASRSAAALSSSLALHQMNSRMSGWSTSSTTILAARRVLPPDLIVPAQASAPRMKETGPEAVPPLPSGSIDPRMFERLMPEPEPPRKMLPSLVFQSEDRLHRVLDREDEAGRALRLLLEADVEPDRRVERRQLVEQDVGQLGLEAVAVLDRGEVAALTTPVGDRAGHARDHLLDRALARGRVQLAAEVLLGDDVRGVLRPRLRELDVLLLERDLVAVADARVARLPLDLLEGVDAGLREQPLDTQRLTHARRCLEGCVWRRRLHRKISSPAPRPPVGPFAEIRGLGRFLRGPDGLEEGWKSGPNCRSSGPPPPPYAGARDELRGRVPASPPRATRSASSAGAPKRSRRPPNAIAQSENHAAPRATPAITSLSQWTLEQDRGCRRP